MQWSAEEHAGFTSGEPWLKENPCYKEINVEEQSGRSDSVLEHYRKLIALRKDPAFKETLVYGDFEPVCRNAHNVIAYVRRSEEQAILVAANFNTEARRIELPEGRDGKPFRGGSVILSGSGTPVIRDSVLYLEGLQSAAVLLEE